MPAALANSAGALAHLIAKRFGKSRIVEDPDLPRAERNPVIPFA